MNCESDSSVLAFFVLLGPADLGRLTVFLTAVATPFFFVAAPGADGRDDSLVSVEGRGVDDDILDTEELSVAGRRDESWTFSALTLPFSSLRAPG